MKEFVMEVRNIYGDNLTNYTINAGSRDTAFEIAQDCSETDFPEYENINIICKSEEPLIYIPIKESEIEYVKTALNRLAIYYDDRKNEQEDRNKKRFYEDLFDKVFNIYIRTLNCEEEIERGCEDD